MTYLITLGEKDTPVKHVHSLDDAVGYCRSMRKKVTDVMRVYKVPYLTDKETPVLIVEFLGNEEH